MYRVEDVRSACTPHYLPILSKALHYPVKISICKFLIVLSISIDLWFIFIEWLKIFFLHSVASTTSSLA